MSLLQDITEEVAKETERDPLELPPLFARVDPDALERCIESAQSPASFQFRYCGCTVIVTADGGISTED